jgi:hypothetical protein
MLEGRSHTLNWDILDIIPQNLSHLEDEFSVDEVRAAINDLPSDKAPGPYGYIGIFYKTTWDIIKHDLLQAVNYFYNQHDQHLKVLNTAHIILIPKRVDAASLADFRPISLTHSVAKLLSKLLVTSLSASLDSLTSRSQNAFIKKRSIHDNFLYTQCVVKELHKAKHPALFSKLDIAKAFDSVRWDYLQEVLQKLVFGPRWRAWVSALLCTGSSAIFVNGSRGHWFDHGRGVKTR